MKNHIKSILINSKYYFVNRWPVCIHRTVEYFRNCKFQIFTCNFNYVFVLYLLLTNICNLKLPSSVSEICFIVKMCNCKLRFSIKKPKIHKIDKVVSVSKNLMDPRAWAFSGVLQFGFSYKNTVNA